jgi:hypothetical protein
MLTLLPSLTERAGQLGHRSAAHVTTAHPSIHPRFWRLPIAEWPQPCRTLVCGYSKALGDLPTLETLIEMQ